MNLWTGVYLSVAVSCMPGCGKDCHEIAEEYAKAKEDALQCDPNDVNACTAERVVPLYEAPSNSDVDDDPSNWKLLGLSMCKHGFNPSRVSKLDAILEEFAAHGCELIPPPMCPPVVHTCGVRPRDGVMACAP